MGLEREYGGKLHLQLNILLGPIENKYLGGKMKRTLRRELDVPELAEREANGSRTYLVGLLVASLRSACFNVCDSRRCAGCAHSVSHWCPPAHTLSCTKMVCASALASTQVYAFHCVLRGVGFG